MDQTRIDQITARLHLFYPEARWITILYLGLHDFEKLSIPTIAKQLDIPKREVQRICYMLTNEARVKVVMQDMNARDQRLLTLRYGLDGYKTHTYIELANEMGESEQAVSKRHHELLRIITQAKNDSTDALCRDQYLDERIW